MAALLLITLVAIAEKPEQEIFVLSIGFEKFSLTNT